MIQNQLSNCTHVPLHSNCKKCGIYLYPDDPAMKSNLYNSVTHCSAAKYLKHLRRRKCQIVSYKQVSEETVELLEAICHKFQFNLETLTLGIYVFAKSCQKQKKDEKFWASVALMVAGKGIELDKKVPYLNRYQRYADKDFSQEDYELAEKVVFEQMNFDLQYSTFITFLYFYLTNGIIFKSDNVSEDSIKNIEKQIIKYAEKQVKKGEFVDKDPEQFALSIIKHFRLQNNLKPWPTQFEKLTGFKQADVKTIEKSILLQSITLNVERKQKQKNSQKQKTEEGLKNRKNLQNFMKNKNEKENPLKILQPTLNLKRNQAYSSSKYSRSTERIVPLHNFITRRI